MTTFTENPLESIRPLWSFLGVEVEVVLIVVDDVVFVVVISFVVDVVVVVNGDV